MGEVIKLESVSNEIALISMEDKEAKNTFSSQFITGINDCFETVAKNKKYKVVVLKGYDNYFACGGTKEELLKVHHQEMDFNELSFYRSALDCPIPVIAAMQGHGIGGGFVFGLYADICVLGIENIYTTNFMNYGFTPGVGATYVVPYKLGQALGHEMLFTGKNYRGNELKDRGVPYEVVTKKEVVSKSIEIAESLAEKPRISLMTLKESCTKTLKKNLDTTIKKELKMHDITFTQPEVKKKIEEVFSQYEK
ncbi:enoyl-CoA hydratase [Candidatus Marinamargulisbacteria bacterium SCGC AG-414-C22]|nr:enoyl-CoA hydratase [Candidatus Marinamargulisbacteria bacterium SCGC AG-414-C22]